MRELNIITRVGSKTNDIKFFRRYLPLDSKIIVEPFAGSFAVSKNIYTDHNKYKFHINDKDEELFYIYKNYKQFIETSNRLTKTYYDDFHDSRKYEFYDFVNNMDLDAHIKGYFISAKFIRGKLFKGSCANNYNVNEVEILNNALLTNYDYTVIFEKYKDDKDAFLFLDPPYLFSNNKTYHPQNDDEDMTKIIIDILDYLETCICKVMLIINKSHITVYLFRKYIKGEYTKMYQLSKKNYETFDNMQL
jgi:site-specific DNA-adenine methylase